MNKEERYFLTLLSGFINENKIESQSDLNWGRILELANIHAVHGIIGYMGMTNPDCFPVQYYDFMRTQCMTNIAYYSRRVGYMENLIELLNKMEIEHLLFKGYVVREYYTIPELRSFGDIDFLIKAEDREKCHQLMIDLGFHTSVNWEPIYSYTRDMELYEIHTDVMEVDVSDKADYKGYYKKVWEYAQPVEGHTWELKPEYHFVYLLTHIAKHIRGSGAGIRMYMDIAFFIKHFQDTIDWKFVENELEKIKLKDFANTVLTLVEKWFHVKSPILLRKIDEQILDDFMDFTLEGGIFGHCNREQGVVTLKQEVDGEEKVSRASTLLRRTFPKAETLEKRYTYLQGRHWLLPIAWIDRFIRTRSTFVKHMNEAKEIMSVEEEKVLRLKRIYTEIGL